MKKSQVKMLFVLIGISLFMLVGIGKVNAAAAVNNFELVCEPSELEIGDKGKCYLIANVTKDPQSGAGIHGVITKATTTNLVITGSVAGNGSETFSSQNIGIGQKFTVEPFTASDNITCNGQGGRCYGFFTKNKDGAGQFKSDVTGVTGLDTKYTNYTTIGYYSVELLENATLRECGQICVSVDFALTGADYAGLVAGVPESQPICAEIKPKEKISVTPEPEPDNPKTGSFASIAVLVAGGLIAIGAIAVSKKNNKFYRV